MFFVDYASMKKVTADPNYKLQSLHFTGRSSGMNITPIVRNRFESMLVKDTAHMMLYEKGIYAEWINSALVKIWYGPGSDSDSNPKEFLPFNGSEKEYKDKQYGNVGSTFVKLIKVNYTIKNYENQFDNIVGKKTIRALDYILYRNGK